MYTPSSHLLYATCDLVAYGTAVPRLYPTPCCIISAPVLSLVKVFITFSYPRWVGSRTFPLRCRSPSSGCSPFLVFSRVSVVVRPLFLYYILHRRSSLLSVTHHLPHSPPYCMPLVSYFSLSWSFFPVWSHVCLVYSVEPRPEVPVHAGAVFLLFPRQVNLTPGHKSIIADSRT